MSRPTVRRRYRIDSECLTLSKVQADLKRAGRRTSAFAFESFATASFDAVLANEEVRGEVEAITHATQQVDVRLRIVHNMNTEMKVEADAALREADLPPPSANAALPVVHSEPACARV